MKKKLLIVLSVVLTLTLLFADVIPVSGWIDPGPSEVTKLLTMYYSCVTGVRHNLDNKCWCGPSSGVSIGWYYKNEVDRDGNGVDDYKDLPSTKTEMYDGLWDYMDTSDATGYTSPSNYGPGFVEMALHYGYDNFSYVPDDYVTKSDFWNVVDAIDHGWPVALFAIGALQGFSGVEALPGSELVRPENWPCEVRHVIAIKGYYYYIDHWSGPGTPVTTDYRICCTDNYSGANKLWLSWGELVDEIGANLRMVVIKDVDTPDAYGPYVEDFEWGSDGASLEDWQATGGEVDWYAYAYGSSRVEIDNAQKHTGSVSARFYRNSYSPYAYYKLFQPSYIGFWLKNDWTVYPEFRNGNGSYAIRVRVGDVERIEYYDGTWHTLPWSLQAKWNRIEFKNISWSGHTFDIYVDGYVWKTGATMWHYSGYNGRLYFGSWTGSGTFWIDDITDSLR